MNMKREINIKKEARKFFTKYYPYASQKGIRKQINDSVI